MPAVRPLALPFVPSLPPPSRGPIFLQVYLVRGHDGFRIPYETVEAVTLIALVRLNLVEGTKDFLYDQLLKMGIYEDMAPWNIAFKGGKLVYIDYDTRDIDLTKLVPMAYQVRRRKGEAESKGEEGGQRARERGRARVASPARDTSPPACR